MNMNDMHARQRGPPQESQLFDDTTQNAYGAPGFGGPAVGGNQQFMQPGNFPGSNVLSDPMANMALQYGQSIAGQGKDFVEKKVNY